MILNQRKEGSQISIQLAYKTRKNSLTLPTWNTLKIKLFQTDHKRCVPAVHAQVKKKSVLLVHSIEYDRSGQNKPMRDEELRKAEYLSTTNDLKVHIGQFNQK